MISLENLYLIKNKIVRIKNRKIPSERTIVQNDASANERIVAFCSYFKKITKEEIPSKIYKGSVIPKKEFSSILGSKRNRDTPIRDILSSKNFRHKK